jgi:hypothetical protein
MPKIQFLDFEIEIIRKALQDRQITNSILLKSIKKNKEIKFEQSIINNLLTKFK